MSAGSRVIGGLPGRSRRSGPFWPMRRLQAGLFPEARRRIGKCLDCGAEGAVAVGGGEAGFLVGACAQMEEQALANKMTAPERANRARKCNRLDASPRPRIT